MSVTLRKPNMKLLLVCLAVVLTVVSALPSSSTDQKWELFKAKYQKEYKNENEEQVRRIIWEKKLEFIRKHNEEYEQGLHKFTVAENQFSDLTTKEFRRRNGFRGIEGDLAAEKTLTEEEVDISALADTVDWRTDQSYNPVSEIKDQGECGSCWSFSASGSIEGAYAIANQQDAVSLSEQNILDCADCHYGNHACRGGWMNYAFKYVINNGGLDTEESYGYEGWLGYKRRNVCEYDASNSAATISSFTNIAKGSEIALKYAVATYGPVSVAIDASQAAFNSYSSGVYDEDGCSTTDLDHGVLVVGYGTSDGSDYWLVKNSWGTSWGMEGYMYMARNNNNQCGISSHASYPVV